MADNVKLEFSTHGLNTMIRQILHADKERVNWLRTATEQAMASLGVKRNLAKAVSKVPEGSDQCDLGSFVAWLKKITKNDTAAIGQLILLDATLASRS